MDRLIVIARLSELIGLMDWIAREQFPDTPIDCPVVRDKIREQCSDILQTYFVRDDGARPTISDTVEHLLGAIEQEMAQVLDLVARTQYTVTSINTFSLDGSARFILTLRNGEPHERSLPEVDSG